jgi:hypothetical protein
MMIHLAVAHEYDGNGDGLFYFANMAPDYTDARAIKDIIHLRDKPDREAALRELRQTLDLENPFELGWLLHLFTDWQWDTRVIPRYRDAYTGDGNWFLAYRPELGRISFKLFREEPWAREVWEKIGAAELNDTYSLTRSLPVPLELGWFARRVRARHERGGDEPKYFTVEFTENFARETAERFREWL